MYVVDITRCNDFIASDMLVGKDSMDAKSKTIKYIMDYVLVNYNIYLDKDVLDQSLNMDTFSLRQFMHNYYQKEIKEDLLIQSFLIDKNHCLFVKHFDRNIDDRPNIYIFNRFQEKKAKSTLAYLMNESLIKKYENNLEIYKEKKFDVVDPKILSHNSKDINIEIISLYRGGLFLEELLDNYISLQQLKFSNYNLKI